ncbi:MAG: hypothetical protein MR639_04910 [Clostridium sp.]|uniref:hypothetical protein n=1 Tax=Clostridium sp. TaxID=1506 RepID=UPI002A8446C2|nr:hypothetical protein [Clostridium sp.]MDY5097099.1 hypothetical protein [Clostridium sp.]
MYIHVTLDLILILLCLSIIYDMSEHRNINAPYKSYSVCLKYDFIAKPLLYFLILCAFINLGVFILNDGFTFADILDKGLFLFILCTCAYVVPKKIYIGSDGIHYFNKHWQWNKIYRIDIYDNVIDILFCDYSRKLIFLEQPTIKEKEELVKIMYEKNAMI